MSNVQLKCVLSANAHTRTATDGTCWLYLELLQDASGTPVRGKKHYGKSPAAHIAAANAAHHLRAGDRLLVHAAAIVIGYRPMHHLELIDVDHIEHRAPLHRQTREAATS